MKFCSDCGKELSDRAWACPDCGAPTETARRAGAAVPVRAMGVPLPPRRQSSGSGAISFIILIGGVAAAGLRIAALADQGLFEGGVPERLVAVNVVPVAVLVIAAIVGAFARPARGVGSGIGFGIAVIWGMEFLGLVGEDFSSSNDEILVMLGLAAGISLASMATGIIASFVSAPRPVPEPAQVEPASPEQP
jgi:hypothetical protein